jgi:hypothetical protein
MSFSRCHRLFCAALPRAQQALTCSRVSVAKRLLRPASADNRLRRDELAALWSLSLSSGVLRLRPKPRPGSQAPQDGDEQELHRRMRRSVGLGESSEVDSCDMDTLLRAANAAQ